MPSLVQFLAAGVNGAQSGTAEFRLRGTVSSAASVLYEDFEGTTQPGTNILNLDANGAVEIYTDAYIDVILRNSAGNILRTVTLGHSAPLVEVKSTSFKGTDYDGNPANTVNNPITLKALLDKWITSAGAPDWQVLFNGVATNIQSALSGSSGMFINVKDPVYGAEGDGVTNDTTAILAACAAADALGGAIVFFPPGTYNVTQLTPTAANIVLMGCGADASTLRSTSSVNALLEFSNTTAAAVKRVTGLGFESSSTAQYLIQAIESQTLVIDNCKFDGENVAVAAFRRTTDNGTPTTISFSDCIFINVEPIALLNRAGDGQAFISVKSCTFIAADDFSGSLIQGPNFSMSLCKFDCSAAVDGSYYHIHPISNDQSGRYLGTFTGNAFVDSGSENSFAFLLEEIAHGSVFSESGNTFTDFAPPADLDDPGHIYDLSVDLNQQLDNDIYLGSREGKALKFTGITLSEIPSFVMPALMAETIIIEYTDAAEDSILVQPTPILSNGDTVIIVLNESNAPLQVVFTSFGFSASENAVPDGGKAVGLYRSFLEEAGSEQNVLLATKQSPI